MALPLLAISAATSIAGGLMNAYAQKSAYKEQKITTRYNQAILDANNRIDQSMIDMDIRRIKKEGNSLIGEQRALIGKSGTKFSGSNIDVFMDTISDISFDVQVMGIKKMVGTARTQQAKTLLDMELKSAKKAAKVNAASSILGGVTSAASTYAGSK